MTASPTLCSCRWTGGLHELKPARVSNVTREDFPSEGETYRSVLLLAVYNVEIQGKVVQHRPDIRCGFGVGLRAVLLKVAEQLSSLVALDTSSTCLSLDSARALNLVGCSRGPYGSSGLWAHGQLSFRQWRARHDSSG